MEYNEEELDVPDSALSLNVQPYMFEPVIENTEDVRNTEESSSSSYSSDNEVQSPSQQRTHNTDWCDCGECQSMQTPLECVCCREIDIVDNKRGELECITNHEGFVANCLNRDVLEVSLYEYVAYEGPLDDNEPIHETYRYVAYRRFVRWIWHRLGKHMRKVLPACVVTKIRNAFPSEEYTGFKYAVP